MHGLLQRPATGTRLVHPAGQRSTRPSTRGCCRASSEPSRDAGGAPAQGLARREALLAGVASAACAVLAAGPSEAVGFKKELKRRRIPEDEYTVSEDVGLKVYELSGGSGKEIARGDVVTVHFDCMYKSLDVVSTRAARLLAGNRTVAEPFSFVAGGTVDMKQMRADGGTANGMFSGQGGPQPPAALSTAVLGMKRNGKRLVIVPPEQGYGAEGMMEIPPGSPFELQVEVLEVSPPSG